MHRRCTSVGERLPSRKMPAESSLYARMQVQISLPARRGRSDTHGCLVRSNYSKRGASEHIATPETPRARGYTSSRMAPAPSTPTLCVRDAGSTTLRGKRAPNSNCLRQPARRLIMPDLALLAKGQGSRMGGGSFALPLLKVARKKQTQG